ncbi:hypothetical protein BDV41DRAFT_552026 [Aspergillus transmontanensis]|uniref:C2H2-type domain-containing protein n=1 Tax=Aspergillus transmontanensis TaxID=1034304 RepID=A0A5N6VIP2_9EURO|nr:hypothetical protein BDV41DRAFT_552026 [Aspergillus transmontanensis]
MPWKCPACCAAFVSSCEGILSSHSIRFYVRSLHRAQPVRYLISLLALCTAL